MSAKKLLLDVVVSTLDELKERQKIVIEHGGTEVGVYFHEGEVRAWLNVCPHQGGPVCQGKTMPRTVQLVNDDLTSGGPGLHEKDLNIVCPWHGLEFDVLTGIHTTTDTYRLRDVPVRVENGDVIVSV